MVVYHEEVHAVLTVFIFCQWYFVVVLFQDILCYGKVSVRCYPCLFGKLHSAEDAVMSLVIAYLLYADTPETVK